MSVPTNERFDRLPRSAAGRTDPDLATRAEVVDWWETRFGIPPTTFDGYTFWEKGAGKVWVLRGDAESPCPIEALGLRCLHTRQEHWKPTTNAIQRFGHRATRNRIHLGGDQAAAFVAGENLDIDWDGEWGYVIATADIGGDRQPLGVGLFTYGTLKSQIPKGRRIERG